MKAKLKIFNDFSEEILPHEATYLLKQNKIRDEEKAAILNKVCYNAEEFFSSQAFDESIDKRKYTFIKKWIKNKLKRADVDARLKHLSFIEKQIFTDTIIPLEEKELLSEISSYNNTSFYFQKFYELVKEYQDYLLIRFRYQDCELTEAFLNKNKQAYLNSLEVKDQLFYATKDLTRQYTGGSLNTKHWEEKLLSYLNNEALDHRNRYNAFVRLVFLYFNYKEYEKARKIFDQIDQWFKEGKMYSKRVLFNYYANRVILHSNLNELEKAEYYAHLSVKQENSDKLFYLNNLIGILLKRGKNKEALEVMTAYYGLFKKSYSQHQKLVYATHYIRTLVRNKRLKIAETFAENFLFSNRQDLFEQRWRPFFSNYLLLLINAEKHEEVIKIVKKYNLLEREKEEFHRENFIPKIHFYYNLSLYMDGQISEEKLMELLLNTLENPDKFTLKGQSELLLFLDRLVFTLPETFVKLKSHLAKDVFNN